MPRHDRLGLGLMLLVLAACGAPRGSEVWIDHPIEDSLPAAGVRRISTQPAGSFRTLDSLVRLTQDTAWTFGEYTGTESGILAQPEDAAWLPDVGFVVLDPMNSAVLLVSEDGRLLSTWAQAGLGPGEFADPQRVVTSSRGAVWVSDMSGRVQEFTVQGGDIVFVRSVRLPFIPRDICVRGERLMGAGVNAAAEGLVHVFAEDGSIEQSFGEAYRMSPPAFSMMMSEADLVCDDSTSTVAFNRLGEVHSFGPDSKLRWAHRLDPFYPMINRSLVGEMRLRSGIARGDVERGHVLLGIIPIDGGYLVQLGVRTIETIEDRTSYASVDTYLLDGRTGAGVLAPHLRVRVLAASDDLLLAYDPEPWPRLIALRRSDVQ